MVKVAKAFAEDVSAIVDMEQQPDTREFVHPNSPEEHAQQMGDPDIVYLRITQEDALE